MILVLIWLIWDTTTKYTVLRATAIVSVYDIQPNDYRYI